MVGSNGFIGKHLVKTLEQSGIEVLSFNSNNLPLNRNGDLNGELLQAHLLIWCASKVNPAVADSSPEIVTSEVEEWKTFIALWKRNALTKSIPIIFISSGGCVYSSKEIPFAETFACNGINAYGIMKSRMERILIEAEIPFKILRAANVYGPGQPVGRGQGVIAEWINAINKNIPVEVYGSLDSFRDFIHVDDVVAAIIACMQFPNTSSVFNIGSGRATTLQEVMNKLTELSSKDFLILQHEARGVDRQGYYLDIKKAQANLMWQPRVLIQKGLQSCLDPEVISYGSSVTS